MLDLSCQEHQNDNRRHSVRAVLTEYQLDDNAVIKWLREPGRIASIALGRIAARLTEDTVWRPAGFAVPAIHYSVLKESLGVLERDLRVKLLATIKRNSTEHKIYAVDPEGPQSFSDIMAQNIWVGGIEKKRAPEKAPIDLTESSMPGRLPARLNPEPAPSPKEDQKIARSARIRRRQQAAHKPVGREIHVEGPQCHSLPGDNPNQLTATIGNSICIAAYNRSTHSRTLIKLPAGLRPASDEKLFALLDNLLKPMTGPSCRILIIVGTGRDDGRHPGEISPEDIQRFFDGESTQHETISRVRIHRLNERNRSLAEVKLAPARDGQADTATISYLRKGAGPVEIIDLSAI